MRRWGWFNAMRETKLSEPGESSGAWAGQGEGGIGTCAEGSRSRVQGFEREKERAQRRSVKSGGQASKEKSAVLWLVLGFALVQGDAGI